MIKLDVIVVGAGIGGTAAALALQLKGHNVTILEAAPKLAEVGAGIQVAPNMLRLLDRWGVGDSVRTRGVAIQTIHILRWEGGKLLGKVPVTKQFGDQFVVHRADLHNALIDRAKEVGVNLRLNSMVKDVDFENANVKLMDGATIKGDVILAADGIKSVIRGKLLGQELDVAEPTGDAVYRVILSRDLMINDPDLRPFIEDKIGIRWVGPGRHIMAYPIRNHELFNMVLAHPQRRELDETWTAVGSKSSMLEEYKQWDARLQKMLSLVPDGEVLEWKLCAHKPLKTWIKGRVALMGDACHPMLPYVAQGAAQAVEDAACLSVVLSMLNNKEDVPTALAAYEFSRKGRAETVQQSGSQTREALHFADGPEQIARDKMFEELSRGGANPDKWGDREFQTFLWDWDAEEDAKKAWRKVAEARL